MARSAGRKARGTEVVGWLVRIAVLVVAALRTVFQVGQFKTLVGDGIVAEREPFQKEKDDLYRTLGELIWDGIPYEYEESKAELVKLLKFLKDSEEDPHTVLPGASGDLSKLLTDGLAKDYGQDADAPKVKKGSDKELQAQGAVSLDKVPQELTEAYMRATPWKNLWWPFQCKQFRVTKAIMIPYSVKDKGARKNTQRHILIGYMGVDSNGG
jgi:hypothetical protein